jgi:hypothetical protein
MKTMFNPRTNQIWQVEELALETYRMVGEGVFIVAASEPICPWTGDSLVEMIEISDELQIGEGV